MLKMALLLFLMLAAFILIGCSSYEIEPVETESYSTIRHTDTAQPISPENTLPEPVLQEPLGPMTAT